MPAPVLAVVVHYDNPSRTARCVEALQAQSAGGELAVVVVDQSEDPGQAFAGSPVIRRPNLGFAAGCNAGTASAASEFVWLVNPDTVAEPDALLALLQAMARNPRLGAVASTLSGEVSTGSVSLPLGRASVRHLERPDFLSAASLLIRRAALEAAGGLDERYFLYWEDVDLCWRLRRSGWELAVSPTSRVGHERGGSVGNASPLQDYYATRNSLLFVARHGPAWLPIATIAVAGRSLGGKALRGEWQRLSASWLGIRDGLAGQTGRTYGAIRKSP